MDQVDRPRRRIALRFTLKTLLFAMLVAGLLIAWTQERNKRVALTQLASAKLKVCDSPAKLKKALGAVGLQVIDFDDVDTSKTDYAPFSADRYADLGITITGESGQYAGRTFSMPGVPRDGGPAQFAANSSPNSYAPGPIAPADSSSLTAGGNRTVVTFTSGGQPARVAAFGAVFIDADWPSEGPTQLTVFGWDGRQIGETQEIEGPNGSRLFRGVVVTDERGAPLPVIARVEIINGSCWPEVVDGECVVLDDFTYSAPVPSNPYLFAGGIPGSPKAPTATPPGQAATPPETQTTVAVLHGHTDDIMGVEFSPGGSMLASASKDKTMRIWDLAEKKIVYQSDPMKTPLETVIYTSKGKEVIVCGGNLRGGLNEFEMRSVADGEVVRSFVGHKGRVNRLRLSHDGKLLASSGIDKTIRVWDVATGKNVATLLGHSYHVYGLSFHPDGKQLASCSRDRTVRVWDLSLGKEIQLFEGHTEQVIDVEFSPDGKHLASACDDKTIRFWDITTGKELRHFLGHGHDIRDICFSPDSQLLASASYDKTVKVWDVSTGKCLLTLKHKDRARTVTFSSNGTNLASACGDDSICVWDLSMFLELKKPKK